MERMIKTFEIVQLAFGLPKNESKVLTTLYLCGKPAEGTWLAETAGIPRVKIYPVMKTLDFIITKEGSEYVLDVALFESTMKLMVDKLLMISDEVQKIREFTLREYVKKKEQEIAYLEQLMTVGAEE